MALDTAGSAPDPEAVGGEVADALAATRQIAPFSDRFPAFSMEDGYRASSVLWRLRGEEKVGRKIGFTNQTLWARYGVEGPMWGTLSSHSVVRLSERREIPLASFCEPRIEPEVALQLAAAPRPDMDEAALLDCVAWFSPAFEIVHSIYPGWRFTLADTAACNALHGALLLGEAVPNAGFSPQLLSDLKLHLKKNEEVVETGSGTFVLGGPLSALKHLVRGLHQYGGAPLEAGEIVTTGTLTDAWPIAPGDTWSADYEGTPFAAPTVRFV
ncbi:2-keto-4-pentenoate hydratase [Acuticoccus kandeliae]|uniref:2-keto-4-pentenoate hydratase n=1 Tax=Acuticoccus kandeliae TaxID=2073160 RepID=UPI000D3E39FC|nr:fumarylacetoacetate hydrolase family protein [Acuticoccus kandeliae]